MSNLFDLTIVGAGPAGAAAAISAARLGHRVLLLERGHFPRQKVCGEFVSSEALELLKELLPDRQWRSSALSIPTARIFINGQVREMEILPAASSITRFELDAALWNEAGKSDVVTLADQPVESVEGDGPFRIITQNDSFDSGAVINAAGRWSKFNATAPNIRGAALGLKRHYFEKAPNPSVDLYFFHGGYCGVQPISADQVNVSAMVYRDGCKTLEDVFSAEPNLFRRSAQWRAAGELVSTYPLIFREPRSADVEQNIFNAGDAAAFIDPFVGDGISMALHSGKLAAHCLSAFLRGDSTLKDSALDYSRQYERRLMPAFRNAARLRRLVASPTLRSVAFELFRIPAISRLALRSTRARVA
jgi:flavin-dependent dehydrogenase